MNRFTPEELKALREVCDEVVPYVPYGTAELYVLSVCAMESDFQRLARNPSGAFGYFQRIDRSRPGGYNVTDGAQQIRDYGAFTLAQIHAFGIEEIPSLGDFYCLNLAPARVTVGVLYAGKGPYKKPLHWGDEKWSDFMAVLQQHPEVVAPKAYEANILFDPMKKGFIALEDLEPKVEAAARRNWDRIELELKALEEIP